MLLARAGRSLVRRGEDMPDTITSNYEYAAVNLSEVVCPPPWRNVHPGQCLLLLVSARRTGDDGERSPACIAEIGYPVNKRSLTFSQPAKRARIVKASWEFPQRRASYYRFVLYRHRYRSYRSYRSAVEVSHYETLGRQTLLGKVGEAYCPRLKELGGGRPGGPLVFHDFFVFIFDHGEQAGANSQSC